MFESVVDSISSSEIKSLHASLTFLVDRGYLKTSKNQNSDSGFDMLQLMLIMRVTFAGTIKDVACFPFHVEDIDKNRMANHNNKVMMQHYSTRTHVVSCINIAANTLKVMVLRHGIVIFLLLNH